MKTAWENEKAYCARRAAQIAADMQTAIDSVDRDGFAAAYSMALRYMSKRERAPYYTAFLRAMVAQGA